MLSLMNKVICFFFFFFNFSPFFPQFNYFIIYNKDSILKFFTRTVAQVDIQIFSQKQRRQELQNFWYKLMIVENSLVYNNNLH